MKPKVWSLMTSSPTTSSRISRWEIQGLSILGLTIYEAKSLEYDDVLLYNFLQDSEVRDWSDHLWNQRFGVCWASWFKTQTTDTLNIICDLWLLHDVIWTWCWIPQTCLVTTGSSCNLMCCLPLQAAKEWRVVTDFLERLSRKEVSTTNSSGLVQIDEGHHSALNVSVQHVSV